MNKTAESIARRYARALYEVAEESGDLTALEKDFQIIETVWRAHPELLSPRHMALLPAIIRAWQELRKRTDAPALVRMEVPAPITADEEADIARRLARTLRREVELKTSVNPELLGGAVLRIGGRMIDFSVRGRLAEAQRYISGEKGRMPA